MDILYTNEVDCFALMSSDSDFTPLVVRLLESGKEVFGFGQKKTPQPFVKACSQFIFTEDLISAAREREEEAAAEVAAPAKPPAAEAAKPAAEGQKSKNELRGDTGLVRMLRLACENTAGDDGWSHMSEVSQYMKNQKTYSPVNYGFKSWSKLIQATDLFEGDLRNGSAMYIRDRRKKAPAPRR
jgi:hypothetical protein